jgi:hypothetical protein
VVPEPGPVVPEPGPVVPEPGPVVPEPGPVVPEPVPIDPDLPPLPGHSDVLSLEIISPGEDIVYSGNKTFLPEFRIRGIDALKRDRPDAQVYLYFKIRHYYSVISVTNKVDDFKPELIPNDGDFQYRINLPHEGVYVIVAYVYDDHRDASEELMRKIIRGESAKANTKVIYKMAQENARKKEKGPSQEMDDTTLE